MHWCPNCQQPFVTSPDNTDFVHNCNSGSDELDNEDSPIIGPLEDDSTAEDADIPTTEALVRGMANKLQGDMSSKTTHLDDYNIFGHPKSVNRIRKHDEFIDDLDKC